MCVSKERTSLLIPSEENFISNKEVSDILYVWILLNGDNIDGNITINQKPRGAYKELGINYRTFYRKIDKLLEYGYIEKDGEYKYKISSKKYKYKRYVYKDIIKELYDTKINNIIKVYIYLSSLYDTNQKKGIPTYFRYNTLAKVIGYYGGKNRDSRNEKKVGGIVKKLSDMKLISYTPQYTKVGEKYQTNFILDKIVTK